MTVTADQEVRVGPMLPQRGQEPNQAHGIFRPSRAGARAQEGRDQRVGGPFDNEARQITMVLIVMVIEGKRLLAMGGIIGMIEIEHNGRRGLGVAGKKMIDQGGGETVEVLAVNLVFKT